jgi:hypothetical protein
MLKRQEDSLNMGHSAPSGDTGKVWRQFWLAHWLGRRESAPGIQWVEARDAALCAVPRPTHPGIHSTEGDDLL